MVKRNQYNNLKIKKSHSMENTLKLLNGKLLSDYMPPSIIIDDNNKITKVIGTARQFLKPTDNIYEKSIFKLLPSKLIRPFKNGIRKAKTEIREVVIEYISLKLNGHKKQVEIVIKPYWIEEYIYIIISFMDIKNEEEVLKNRIKELKEEDRQLRDAITYEELKTEFFSNLSHELRTPINVILSSLQLTDAYIEDDNISRNTAKLIKNNQIMKQNCLRLLRLVNNMIDITRIDSGFFDIKFCNNDIVYILEEITQSVALYVKEKNITIIFDTDIEEKIIACDSDLIERILLNLLSNAVKCTKEEDTITVSLYDYKTFVRIIVKDTGIGIPEDKLPIIFERFRQADKSLKRIHEGSGIGLSIVKSLVEMHGGNIAVTSKLGIGTEFIIDLPALSLNLDEEACAASSEIGRDNIEKIQIEFSDIYQ